MSSLPAILANGGLVFWLILFISTVAIVVFVERFLHYHRAQINSTEFLNGPRVLALQANFGVVESRSS